VTDPQPSTASRRAAAVVVRQADVTLDVPVLCIPADLPWNHLLHLLMSAVSASGSSGAMGDLFALANSIAAMVGGAVAIEDPSRRVLAYSSLPDQPIDAPGSRAPGPAGAGPVPQRRDLPADAACRRRHPDPRGRRRAAPAGGRRARRSGVARSIWVVEAAPLPTESEQALLDAGRLAALHLLRARAAASSSAAPRRAPARAA